MSVQFEYHEIANIFPMMSPEERAELKAGMKDDGYDESHPIWLYQNKIIDGRNRYEIANELGLEPLFAEYKGSNPLGFAIQENLHRRHLTTGQRSIVAARMKPIFTEEAKRRMLAGDNQYSPVENLPEGSETGRARDKAAKSLNVSGRSVDDAEKLINERPDLAKEVELGTKSLHEAVEESKGNNVHVANNSGENEWYTPPQYIEAARLVMGSIDTDPASCDKANEIVKAANYFTKENSGLDKVWNGNVWMNPPYAQPLMSQFAEAVSKKYNDGEIEQACVLINNATETGWFQTMAKVANATCFIKGRIKFLDKDGIPANTPLQGQAILYFGKKLEDFKEEFTKIGIVLFRH